jgi:hypothetical protein
MRAGNVSARIPLRGLAQFLVTLAAVQVSLVLAV